MNTPTGNTDIHLSKWYTLDVIEVRDPSEFKKGSNIMITRSSSLLLRRAEDALAFIGRAMEIQGELSESQKTGDIQIVIDDAYINPEKHTASVRFYVYLGNDEGKSYSIGQTQVFPLRERIQKLTAAFTMV